MQDKYKRSIFFTKLSIPSNLLLAAAKLFLAIFSGSLFLGIHAIYNVGIALAKFFSLYSMSTSVFKSSQTPRKKLLTQNDYYMVVGGIVMIFSVVYLIYCIRMFVGEKSANYDIYTALVIATVTFAEIIVAVRGSIITRKDKATMIEAIKLTNLASSLISLVLTQTAILSFTLEGDASFYNGISGMVFGGIAALIGLYMILRMQYIKSGKHSAYLIRKIKKVADKSFNLDINLHEFEEGSNFARLFYYPDPNHTVCDLLEVKKYVKKKMNIQLIEIVDSN